MGVHATVYGDCLDQDCVDYAFVGEADKGIIDFVEALENNGDVTKIRLTQKILKVNILITIWFRHV